MAYKLYTAGALCALISLALSTPFKIDTELVEDASNLEPRLIPMPDDHTPYCQATQTSLGRQGTSCNSKTWTYSCLLASQDACHQVTTPGGPKGARASSGTCTVEMSLVRSSSIDYSACLAAFQSISDACLLPNQNADPAQNSPNMRGWININPYCGSIKNGSLPAFKMGSNNCIQKFSPDCGDAGVAITLADPKMNGEPSSTNNKVAPPVDFDYAPGENGTLTAIGGGKTRGEGSNPNEGTGKDPSAGLGRGGSAGGYGNVNPE